MLEIYRHLVGQVAGLDIALGVDYFRGFRDTGKVKDGGRYRKVHWRVASVDIQF